MKIYIVRHGQSVTNIKKIMSNEGNLYGLTDSGKQQIHTLAQTLKNINFDKIYSSPLLRAKESAEIISNELNLYYELSNSLKEFNIGVLENTSEDQSLNEEHAVFTEWMIHKNWDISFKQGESYNDIIKRFTRLLNKVKETDAQNILFVSHGGIIQCVIPYLCNNISYEYCYKQLLENAEYTIIKIHKNNINCIKYNNDYFKNIA